MQYLHTIVKLFAVLAVARALLQYLNADFNNVVSQFIFRVTVLPIKVLRVFVPRVGGKDLLSPLVLAFLITSLERYLYFKGIGTDAQVLGLIVLTFSKVIEYALGLMVVAIIGVVIFSWISTSSRFTGIYRLVITLTQPLMVPIGRFFPAQFGGLDFTPIIALLLLELTEWIAVGILESVGYGMIL